MRAAFAPRSRFSLTVHPRGLETVPVAGFLEEAIAALHRGRSLATLAVHR